jgi:hypothetical protein
VNPACARLELDGRGRAAQSSAPGVGRTAHSPPGASQLILLHARSDLTVRVSKEGLSDSSKWS